MSDVSKLPPLPPHTVKYVTDPNQMSDAALRGMISNPIYVGIPPYQRMISDEAWVRAATQLIEKEGAEQFLVNMLYMLRNSMVDAVPVEAVPNDYDGPWPEDEDPAADMSLLEEEAEPVSPWIHPMEGTIFCSHDELPMIMIDGEFMCVSEYLYSHLAGACITDLVTQPVLTLVFQNGHTLPLLCPDCGQSLHVDDNNELLNSLSGLMITAVVWDADTEELEIEFGRSDDPEEEEEPEVSLSLHLDSVRELTCPNKTLAENEVNEDLHD